MIKINPKLIFYTVLIILACFLSWCSGRDSIKPVIVKTEKPDTITPKIKHNKADIIVLVDSAKILKEKLQLAISRKNYYKQKYKSVYDSVYSASDSTCKSYLTLVSRVKQKQDSLNEVQNQANLSLIVNAYNQIGKYQDNEIQYEFKIKEVRDSVKVFADSIPKVAKSEFKRGKRVGRKQGFVGGLILIGAVIVGIKTIVP